MHYERTIDEERKQCVDRELPIRRFADDTAAPIRVAVILRSPLEQEVEAILNEQRQPEEIVFKKPPFRRDSRGVLRRVPTEPESLADREGLLRFLSVDAIDDASEVL